MKCQSFFLVFVIAFFSCKNNRFQIANDDTFVTNGAILTVNERFQIAESMVIRGSEIVYVGKTLDNQHYDFENVIDLQGKTVMPELIEPHTHDAASALLYNWVDISGFTHETADDALEALRQVVAQVPDDQWVMAFGWDAMLLQGAYPPYRDVLDQISDKHPIWVMMQSMHSNYFNSYALNLAGINDDVKNPPQGGFYEKDENGRLTGLITESTPLAPFTKVLPRATEIQQKALLQKQYSMYNKEGVTAIGIAGLVDGLLPSAEKIMQEIAQSETPNLRVFLYRDGVVHRKREKISFSNAFFKFLGHKYWADGSPYTGTMLLREPYVDSDLVINKLSIERNSLGQSILPVQVFEDFTKSDAEEGMQIAIHAQGDSAVSNTLSALQNVISSRSRTDGRHRLEHLALVTEDQINTMAEMGITPSFHINHIYYYGDFLASIVGEERANQFMPVGLAARKGMKFSLHNDSPMYPPKPLLAVQSAVSRKTQNGRVLGSEYAVPVEEALKAVTIYAAWQMFAEDEIGSLEVGKKADFIILDKNPLEVDVDSLAEINVVSAYLDGKKNGRVLYGHGKK